jgi:hypothetical protein
VESSERDSLLQQIIETSIDEHELYNAGLRRSETALNKALIVIHLANTRFGVRELSAQGIMRILEGKFAVAEKQPAIYKALTRAADSKPPLVAPKPAKSGKIFWLTQQGNERAEELLNDSVD